MIGMEGARGGMAWDVLRVRVCLRVCVLYGVHLLKLSSDERSKIGVD